MVTSPKRGEKEHKCSPNCNTSIPLQTCGDVCGVAVLVMAAIASCAQQLWRESFLNKSKGLPTQLKWMINPTRYSDFLRWKLISWFLSSKVEITSLGIAPEVYENSKKEENSESRESKKTRYNNC